jgi:hypothetical protein
LNHIRVIPFGEELVEHRTAKTRSPSRNKRGHTFLLKALQSQA